MYEAEIKLVVHEPQSVRAYFDERSRGEAEAYTDTYLKHHLLVDPGSERELRVREVQNAKGARSILSFKDKVVETDTQSKREYEAELANAGDALKLLVALGFEVEIQLQKNCVNWRLQEEGQQVLATLVVVPELAGHFLELEVLVDDPEDVGLAIDRLRQLARRAGLSRSDETTATYTEAVRSARTVSS